MLSSETRSNFRKRKCHRKTFFQSPQNPWNPPKYSTPFKHSISRQLLSVAGERLNKVLSSGLARWMSPAACELVGVEWGSPSPCARRPENPLRPAWRRARQNRVRAAGSEQASGSQRPSLSGRGGRVSVAAEAELEQLLAPLS